MVSGGMSLFGPTSERPGGPSPLLISEGSPGRDDLLRCLAAMERTHPLAASCLKAIANHEEFVALMADLAALSAWNCSCRTRSAL